jgi:hypothetical protein
MVRGAEARAAMVAAADLRLAEAGVPAHQDIQISHEAIYRSLFIQTRGVLKKELTATVLQLLAQPSTAAEVEAQKRVSYVG